MGGGVATPWDGEPLEAMSQWGPLGLRCVGGIHGEPFAPVFTR